MPIREQLNTIQEFTLWFIQENPLKLEESLFAQKKDELLDILQDIVTAIEENDYVLMNDAITYGIMEYLNGCQSEISEEEYMRRISRHYPDIIRGWIIILIKQSMI